MKYMNKLIYTLLISIAIFSGCRSYDVNSNRNQNKKSIESQVEPIKAEETRPESKDNFVSKSYPFFLNSKAYYIPSEFGKENNKIKFQSNFSEKHPLSNEEYKRLSHYERRNIFLDAFGISESLKKWLNPNISLENDYFKIKLGGKVSNKGNRKEWEAKITACYKLP